MPRCYCRRTPSCDFFLYRGHKKRNAVRSAFGNMPSVGGYPVESRKNFPPAVVPGPSPIDRQPHPAAQGNDVQTVQLAKKMHRVPRVQLRRPPTRHRRPPPGGVAAAAPAPSRHAGRVFPALARADPPQVPRGRLRHFDRQTARRRRPDPHDLDDVIV